MPYLPVVVVDEHDNEIGSAMLAEVWQKGLYHRIVSIFVQDGEGRMLLQLRGQNVAVYPNCWDQAAGGHVDGGQTYDQAARNELLEEVGLEDVELTTLGTYHSNNKEGGHVINQFERVYLARVLHGVELHAEADEVSKLRWFTPKELKQHIAKHPETFTPGLLYCLHEYFPDFAKELQ
ncbi:MAG TPA: NUDIX domain-containing protein [Candidatus Saccharimonadales bacterium]